MLKDPFPCSGQELPTTLRAGDADQRELPRPIHPRDVFEAQKLEGLWSSVPMSLPRKCRKASKENVPSLFLSQLQSEFSKPLPNLRFGNGPRPLGTGKSREKSRVKGWLSDFRSGMPVRCGFPLMQCPTSPIMAGSPSPSHPTVRSVFPNTAVR